MNFKNEDAVSPVIGVILMVAITVILAAVIAAFVFGMSGNVDTQKMVAATATQQGTSIVVTYQGGADYLSVTNLTVTVTNSTGGAESNSINGTPEVGWSCTFNGTEGRDHIVVVAKFADGSSQVVLDTFV
ncbi:MAG: type IV pilin N-terminal domain-containing protein [Methanoculleus sp.]|nr:type IV pilin N-terminal domain-containing protein [Methanoculleus sp.]